MNVPLTRTKILLPRRPSNLLTRQRLLNLLYDLLDYKLIIVTAPAGYGKTSLLLDLAHEIEQPVCWYALDELDRDIHRFAAYFIAAIAERFPTFGKQSSGILHSAASGDLDLDRLLTVIVNEAYEQIREHFLLVLDDYHLVDDHKQISYFVNRFVQEADDNCHLILSTRSLLTLHDLPLMVARAQVSGLDFEELAFRPQEIQALVLKNYQLTMPESEAQELAQETEGWITGLLLSAQTMWQGMADRVRMARVSGVGLYDYLAQQVLDQQPVPVQDFLLHSSLLEEFNADFCEAVLGSEEDWQRLIDILLRDNLFVQPVGEDETWLRYHHLFRDFLQARLARERPEEQARILSRLGDVYAERQEWEKAHKAYQRVGDVEATANLIERAGPALVKSGRLALLAAWIDALPDETTNSRPGLLSLRGMAAVMQGEVEKGLALQNQAQAAFRKMADWPRLARALVRRAVAHHFLGDYQASLADANETLSLVNGGERLSPVRAGALRAKGTNLLRMGQLPQAIDWLQQSINVYNKLGDEQNVAMLSMELGLAHMNANRHKEALAHYERALEFWQKAGDVVRQANLLNNLGVLYHLQGDYERAGALLEEALDCATRSGYARMEAFTLSSLGDLYADLDAPSAAQEAYRRARETAQRIDERFLLVYLDLVEAAALRSLGKLSQAHALLESAQQRIQESGSRFEQGLWHLEEGRLALAEKRLSEAVEQFGTAAQHFQAGGQRVESACAHLYLALAHRARGEQKSALAHLTDTFRLTADLESRHKLVIAGREAKSLLTAAQDEPAVGRPTGQLLDQVAKFEKALPNLRRDLRRQASLVPFAPPRLTIHALGTAEVELDGKPVTEPEWQSRQQVRDLFFLLLAQTEGLTKEAIGATFWPDATPAQVKLRFKNAIYRLRRALGNDVILFDGTLYHFNRKLDYEYDVETLERKMAQAEAAASPLERAEANRKVVRLYSGPYLPETEGTWVLPERERLWRAFVNATVELAEFHLEKKEYEITLDYCQRILSEDPCLEEAHRLAMRAHAALGNRAAVARQFERCQQTLREELNVPPSPQTTALYETLVR